ncbi:MAG: alpha/beta fold hydrolase [Pseudomonadota bacterium]
MANFLLIHGASHGAWCWAKLQPLLATMGHRVHAIDLPGHGADPTPRDQVTMGDYVDRVIENLSPNTILVGHSFGGFPITLAAARAPEMVRKLVYLCALLPRPGRAFTAFRSDAISAELSAAQSVDRNAGVTHPIPEMAGPVFYSSCTDADRDWALAQLTPQPIAVMTEVLEFTPPETERHYIRCLKDRVIYPAFQKAISADWPDVHDMDTDHSPFLSDPESLARLLDTIATN